MGTRVARQAPREGAVPERPELVGVETGRWLFTGRDGRLTAYLPVTGGILRWTQTRVGAQEWAGPDFLAAPRIRFVSLVQGADGYVHFLGRRNGQRPDGKAVVEIVHAIQYQTGRPMAEWRSLGNAFKDPAAGLKFGRPSGVVDADGTLHVFVRTGDGGVRLRREGRGGKWGGWEHLGGGQALHGLAPAVSATGRIELLAPGRRATHHWYQTEPGGPFHRGPDLRQTQVPGSLVGLETAQERLSFYGTERGSTGIVVQRPDSWPVRLGEVADGTQLAACRTLIDGDDCTALAHRGPGGTILMTAFVTESEADGVWWSDTGRHSAVGPGLAVDGTGRLTLAGIDDDGSLWVTRQTEGPGLTLGGWYRA
ncbi:hypothetical protein ACFC0M_04270 [Streptomyces sp. NPDC056149]|uniref:hypothetical protein n=1 Tax=Streptomyces sp. NPDC056149 TaxID=3345728 RepID=UPI0035E03E12